MLASLLPPYQPAQPTVPPTSLTIGVSDRHEDPSGERDRHHSFNGVECPSADRGTYHTALYIGVPYSRYVAKRYDRAEKCGL